MKRKRLFGVLSFLVLMFFAVSCTHTQTFTVPDVASMTLKDKATLAMQTYLDMRASYETQVKLPDLSDAEKQVLKGKKELIETAGPMIKRFTAMAKGDTTLEQEVLDYINTFLIQYRY